MLGCTPIASPSTGNFGKLPPLQLVHERAARPSQTLLAQFTAAHARADSIVKLAIPDAQHWASLTTHSGFSYPNWEAHLTDTLPGPATEYKFYYGLLYQGDTIQSAVVSIGPDLRVYPSELAELVAYQQFLQGDLTIGQRKAVAIATHYGLQEAGASVTFHSGEVMRMDTLATLQAVRAHYANLAAHPLLYYWDLRSACNNCAWLRIGAASGQVLQQGKTVIMY